MKCDFNPKIFSHNIHDYLMKKELNSEKTIFLANFTPLNFLCVVRFVTTLNRDRNLYQNECYINRKLKHSNLLQLYQSFIQGEALISVMPYCEYGTVSEFVKPSFGIKESITALIMSDVLKAVDYLHQNMIIHRAIKGSHILIISDGSTSVQFLLSGLKYAIDMSEKLLLQSYEYPLNASQNLHSMAPEIFEQNTIGYNYKVDIYSIGLVCCETSNGFVPFIESSTDELLLSKIIGDQPLLLDSTVIPLRWEEVEKKIIDSKEEAVIEKLKMRHKRYLTRKYSDRFRDFVSVGCLHIEPARRLTAQELLSHSFMFFKAQRHSIVMMMKKND